MQKFRLIEHADLPGMDVCGDDLSCLFQHAGEAFIATVTEAENIRLLQSRQIFLHAERVEDLLVRWLNELVFLFDRKKLLVADYDIVFIDERRLQAKIQGEAYDERRHTIKTRIKCASFHRLRVKRKSDSWRARVFFEL